MLFRSDIVLEDKDIVTLGDTIQDREDGQAMERMMILRDAIDGLKVRDWKVLQMELAGYSQEEIARAEGISQSGVSRVLKQVRNRIAATCAG